MNKKQCNEMTALTQRAEQWITSRVTAERIPLDAEVTRIHERMTAFAAVLARIATEKAVLAEHLADATGPMQALLQRQIDLLTAQEQNILEQIGVRAPVPQQESTPENGDRTAKRKGRLAAQTNGNGD